MKVYVVTSVEMGWDCVCGVYTVQNDEEFKQLQRAYKCEDPNEWSPYVITEQVVKKFDLADFDE